jgi:O-antigen ligase
MPVLVVVAATVWIGAPKMAYILSLIAVGGIGTQINAILDNFIYVGDNSYSETTRLAAWGIIIKMINVNPFFGLGPANYSFYTPLFPILGWNVQFNSHNNYVDIIAQTGILGIFCFLWVFWEVGRLGWRMILRVRKMEAGFAQAYVYGVTGGLVATVAAAMLGDWFLPYVYNITIRGMRASMLPWLFFGGLIALNHLLDQQEQAGVTSDS